MTPLSGYHIGFIGLGLMGRPMSLHLHDAGARLTIHNRSRTVVDELVRPGIEAADRPIEVARRASIVVLMVSDTPAVEQVIFGPEGLISGLHSRTP